MLALLDATKKIFCLMACNRVDIEFLKLERRYIDKIYEKVSGSIRSKSTERIVEVTLASSTD